MARYRIINTVTASFFDVFATNIQSSSATQVVVLNTDGTFTIIAGTGLALSGGVATAGTITSITRSTAAVGGTTLEIGDQLNANNNSFVSFWNAANNAARFAYSSSQNDQGFGSSGVDLIDLGIGDNDFTGYAGNDSFAGNIGFDFLSYAAEMSAAVAGTQGVIVNMSSASVTATVTGGTFTVASNTAKDSYGFTDSFSSMDGASGTSFNDALYGNSGNNVFRGYAGTDFIDGGLGFDELSAMSANASGIFLPTAGMTVTYTAGTSFDGAVSVDGFGGSDTFLSIERIRGTQFADTLNGNDADNSFRGLGGADILNGGVGFDQTNHGQDSNYGGTAGVIVNLSGASVTETIAAGTFTVASNTARDGFGATDTLNSIENVVGTSVNDVIVGGAWDNDLNGGGGNDTITGGDGFDFLTPGGGTDILNGAPGSHPDQAYDDQDYVSYNDGTNGVGVIVNLSNAAITETIGAGTFTVAATSARDFNGNTDTLIDIERVRGTNQADYLRGSDTANLRNELLEGLAGNDVLNGGLGADTVRYDRDTNNGGNSGVIVNLSGVTINGTIQAGTFAVASNTARDGFGNTDTLIGIEAARGTEFDDVFVGDANRNTFRIVGGSDTIDGGGGIDIISMYVDDTFPAVGATVNLANNTATAIGGGISTLASIEDVDGSTGADTITGDGGDNNLSGNFGNDVIDGGAGDDTIDGGAGSNALSGGAGIDDILTYMYDPAYAQNYNLQYPTQLSVIDQGVTVNLGTNTATNWSGGTDTLSGFENVIGTFFNDNITGDGGNNGFDGLSGNDVIDGGGGVDLIYYGTWDNNGRSLTLLPGINGSDPNGVMVNLATHTANDGEGGTDTLTNIENVVGSKGVDTITGDAADNRIEGGAGGDLLDGGAGSNDTASYEDSQSGVTVTVNGSASGGDAQGDTLSNFENLLGSSNSDVLTGDGGVNRIEGNDGNDTVVGLGGNDILDGGLGGDTADYTAALQAVTAILAGGTASGADVGSDTLISIENVTGGAGGDSMFGDANDNVFTGNGGIDVMFGEGGHDTLNGGDGADTIVGNAGSIDANGIFAQESDIIDGGAGNDTINGEFTDVINGGTGTDFLNAVNSFAWTIDLGATSIEWMFAGFGDDTINASTQSASVTIFASGGNDILTGSAFDDFLWAGAGNDTLNGGNGADLLFGDTGADIFNAGDGNDVLFIGGSDVSINGGNGNDVAYITTIPEEPIAGMSLDLSATSLEFIIDSAGGNDTLNGASNGAGLVVFAGNGTDIITGGTGSDFLWGEAGADTVSGGNGNDILVGGAGGDTLNGGTGIDTIYANGGGGGDLVADVIRFDAAGFDTDFVYDFEIGLDKLNMNGTGAASGTISITNFSGNAHVHFGSDLIVVVGAGATLTTADFVF